MFSLNQILSLAIPLIITIASLQLSKKRLQNQAETIKNQAQSNADSILKEAQDFVENNKQDIAQIQQASLDTQNATEARIKLRENSLQKRLVKLDKVSEKLSENQSVIATLNSNLQTEKDNILSELSKKICINAFHAKQEVQDELVLLRHELHF